MATSTTHQDDALRLGRVLDVDSARLRGLAATFDGSEGGTALLRQRLAEARLSDLATVGVNWSAFALGVLAERIALQSWSIGGTDRADAWSLWRRHVPATDEALLWLNALVYGRSGLLSWADESGAPFISVESPFEWVHEVDARTGEVSTALKRWTTREGQARGLLLYRDRIVHLASDQGGSVPVEGLQPGPYPVPLAVSAWTTTAVEPNPAGRVPFSPIVLRRSVRDTLGRSDLEALRGPQRALDKTLVDVLSIAEASAAPRRWATGIEVPEDADGQPYDPFSTPTGGAPSMTIGEPSEAKFGSFPAADVKGLLDAAERLTETLLSLAAVPRHLSVGGARGQSVDASSVRAHEAALLARVAARQASLGPGAARAVRLAMEIGTGRDPGFVEPTWKPAGTSALSADFDAISKGAGAGLDPVGVAKVILGLSADDAEALRPAAAPQPTIEVAR